MACSANSMMNQHAGKEHCHDRIVSRLASNDPELNVLELMNKEFDDSANHVYWEKMSATFSHNSTLQQVILKDCHLGDCGASILARGLVDSPSIEAVQFKHCRVGLRGAAALAQLIGHSRTLRRLCLSYNELGNDGVTCLGQALADAEHTNLFELDLSVCNVGNVGAQELFKGLQSNSSVQVLSLENNDIGPQGVAGLTELIPNNGTLRKINLNENDIFNDGAIAIAKGFEAAGSTNKSNLKELQLDGCRIQNKGATALAQSLCGNTCLETLDLAGNDLSHECADGISRLIETNRSLQVLILSENEELGDAAAETFAQGLQKQSPAGGLREFNMSGCKITSKGATALAQGFMRHKSMELVDLSENDIGDEGAVAFAKVIGRIQTTPLPCSSNGNKGKSASPCQNGHVAMQIDHEENGNSSTSTTSPLSTGFASNIRVLHLGSCGIGDTGAVALAQGLTDNTILTTLNVSRNNIGSKGGFAFAKLLRTSNTIQELFLGCNEVRDAGAVQLADALQINKSLERLCLYDCDISDVGAKAFGPTLRHNAVLKYLEMDHNQICDSGAVALANALPDNQTLMRLSLLWNEFDGPGFEALSQMLKSNMYIAQVGVCSPTIDYYLALNGSGRRLLKVDNAPMGLWAYLLAKVGTDHAAPLGSSMIYYFLQEKPDLCSFVYSLNKSHKKRKTP